SYDLPLPGQGMEDITITEISKEKIKEQAKENEKKRKSGRSIVPAVLQEEKVTSALETEESRGLSGTDEPEKETDKLPVTDNIKVEMENKTAAEVKNIAAKEVGASDAQYSFPPMKLLKKNKSQATSSEGAIRQNAVKLQEVLKSFGVNVTMTNYSCGPSVTRYEMVPEQGVKVSKITGLADDIMMNLAAQSIRIEAPIPGKSAVGIEIPNSSRRGVGFRELIDTEKFIKHPSKLAFAVGMDIEGNVIVEDIAKMPHLLIAGATGSGKSVCTNTLIMSILYKARPDEVKLILVDPKQVELKVYNGIPHLLTPVVTDPKKAAGALNWAVAEMTKRYQMFSECNVRNIQGYNAKVEELLEAGQVDQEKLDKMPQIVIIVDELADLMMVAKAEVEEAIVRLAQLARAAGIHLVIATQRPSVDVVTGLIKA
ncbi:MAG: DNA translocase FtsK, partial [Lachnospiraceae bacterium]|nr:DNA translocase FtsK [Lachnospiraceae bacterium]